MSKTPTELEQSLGKHIAQLCPFRLGQNNDQNHCAHYVSHMMGYEFPGATCKNFTWADKQSPAQGASIRVDDIFKKCTKVDLLLAKPADVAECLIFVTLASNIKKVDAQYTMGNHPKKHIGILHQGNVWNYSNTDTKVVSEPQADFVEKFTNVYKTSGTTVEFYYGAFI